MSERIEVIRCGDCEYRDEREQCSQWPCWSFPNPEVPEDGYCYKAEKKAEAQHGTS
jgi:hypothetical protein